MPASKFAELLSPSARVRIEASGVRSTTISIGIEELLPEALLGEGTYGRVMLVQRRDSDERYALKVINKQQIIRRRQQRHALDERRILASLDHPFLIKLHATYKTPVHLCMLLELCLGGELFHYMDLVGAMPEAQARFFVASMTLALEYLHARRIAFRDLKPENILVDARGYTKLADFGFAKDIVDRSYTMCGTPEYLAPEVISMEGHALGVDWWALGILIYDLIMGYTPFTDQGEKTATMAIYANIKNPAYTYERLAPCADDLLQGLICRNSLDRLGCRSGGAQDIKDHAWFGTFSFGALYDRQLRPPFIPTINHPGDTSNFDWDGEEDSFNCMLLFKQIRAASDSNVFDPDAWDAAF